MTTASSVGRIASTASFGPAERDRQHQQDRADRPADRVPLGRDHALGRAVQEVRQARDVGRCRRTGCRRRRPAGTSNVGLLAGASCRSEIRAIIRGLLALAVPEALQQVGLGRGLDQRQLRLDRLVRLRGLGSEQAAVGVEDGRQRDRPRDRSPARPLAHARRSRIEPGERSSASLIELRRERDHDRDQADAAEPRLGGVVVADHAGVGREGVDVVRLVVEVRTSPTPAARPAAGRSPTTRPGWSTT